jgi:hypothetical protein
VNKNALFGEPTLPDFDKLEQMRQACLLSAEELAVSDATIQRIKLEDRLERFTLALRGNWIAKKGTATYPDFLKLGGVTDAEQIERLFANLDSIEQNILDGAAADGFSRAQAEEQKAAWMKAREQETLKTEAAAKVRHGLDLRSYMIGALRCLGYSGAEIRE